MTSRPFRNSRASLASAVDEKEQRDADDLARAIGMASRPHVERFCCDQLCVQGRDCPRRRAPVVSGPWRRRKPVFARLALWVVVLLAVMLAVRWFSR